MRLFDLDVIPGRGSWLIKLDDRVMSGAATRAGAERIARHAAETLRLSGSAVRLRVAGPDGRPGAEELLPAHAAAAA